MSQTIDEIEIFAYLAPHPTDDFSGLEGDFLEWIPGFLNENDEKEGIDAIYRNYNLEIYNKIEELTEFHFKNGVKTMWPLLSEVYIRSMQVAIDISGLISPGRSSLAGYLYDRSNHLKGNYVFQLDLNLLVPYLNKNEKNEPLDFHENSIWEHELIHLLDHKYITKASIYCNSKSPYENFKYYLIKYREEGIANLYYILNGYTEINNIQEAIELFKEKVINRKSEINFSTPTSDKIKDSIFEGINYYKIGPWLILEILRDYETNFEEEVIFNIIKKLESKASIPLESIYEVIKKALDISPEDFLYFIEKYFEEGFIPLI
jgi:hypothetical protein